MRMLLSTVLLFSGSMGWAQCDSSALGVKSASARTARFGQRLRGVATAAAVATGAITMTAAPAQAATFMTLEDVRKVLTEEYSYSAADADHVVKAIEKADPERKLPITGTIHTSGLDFSLFLGSDTWRNVTVNFKDQATDRTVTTNCLYDMYYENGGFVASLGYKWVVMILVGDMKVNELAGATFGRGIGLTIDAALGADVQYLPSDNRAAGMFVINPQIGAGAGIRFPRATFMPAASCPR